MCDILLFWGQKYFLYSNVLRPDFSAYLDVDWLVIFGVQIADHFAIMSQGDEGELIRQVVDICQTDEATARSYLQLFNWNLNVRFKTSYTLINVAFS